MMKFFYIPILFFLIISCQSKEYEIGKIETPKGEILFWLHEQTPIHKESFIKLSEQGYWDSLTFNRVIENFVIQGGCPDTPEGFGDSPYLLNPEFHKELKHVYGAVGAGRDNNPEKKSAGCQFYIVHDKEPITRLDGDYTIFGQVFKGLDVLETIAMTQVDSTNTPLESVNLKVRTITMTEKELKSYGFKIPVFK